MSDKDEDKEPHGFPDSIFEIMQKRHEKFMRNINEESQRFDQDHQEDKKPSPARSNFFISFKDFVDSNLNSLADSFRSLPANIAELKARMQEERERRQQEELEVWRRWTGLEESPDHCQMLRDRASKEQRQEAVDAALLLLREARDRNAHVPLEKLEAFYADDGVPAGPLDALAEPMIIGSACGSKSGFECGTAIGPHRSEHRWLSVEWFKRSAYSPISIEEHYSREGGFTNVNWRLAFEDLLDAALDKPMTSGNKVGFRPPHGKPQSTVHGPGLDWMLSLQCRGILPPQLPAWHRHLATHKQVLTDELLAQQAKQPFGWLRHDIQHLVDEIATPPAPSGVEQNPSTGFTELDFQEHLEQYGAAEHADESERAERKSPTLKDYANIWKPTGDREVDSKRIQDGLFRALSESDFPKAKDWLNMWHLAYGDEALKQSDIGETDFWHRRAHDHDTTPTEPWDRLSPAERRERRHLERRGSQAVGETWPHPLFMPLENLREVVESLEQQAEALGLQTSAQPAEKATAPPSEPNVESLTEKVVKKVDVLSSLTTTQTTRLPDGTVTTKAVLKQRFADGREETEEKIHTYQEPPQARERVVNHGEKPAKQGWFWS